MASENPRQGGKLLIPTSLAQKNDEVELIDLIKENSNGTSNSIEILDDSRLPFPYFQTADQHEASRVNDHRPWPIGNQISNGSSAPVSTWILPRGEIGISNGAMTSTVQLDHTSTLDGSFLNLGVGSNTETRFNLNACSRDSTNEGVVLPQLDTVCGGLAPNVGEASPSVQTFNRFSNLVPNVGGISGQAQNVGQFSHQSEHLVQNVDSFSNQAVNVNELSTMAPNFGGISSPAQNVYRFPRTLQYVDHLSRSATNEGGRTTSPLVDPNNCNFGLGQNQHAGLDHNIGFQGFPTETIMLLNTNQVFAVPVYGSYMVPRLLPSSSSLGGITIQGRPFWTNEISTAPAAEGGQSSRNSGVQRTRNLGQSPAPVPLHHSINLGGPVYTAGQEIPGAGGSAQASDLPLGLTVKRVGTESPHSIPQAQNRKARKILPFQTTAPHSALFLDDHLIPPPAQTGQLWPAPTVRCPPPDSVTASHLPLAHTSRPRPSVARSSQPRPSLIRPSLGRSSQPRPSLIRPSLGRSSQPRPSLMRPSLGRSFQPRPSLTRAYCRRPSLAQTASHRPTLSNIRPSSHTKRQGAEQTRQPSGYLCEICGRDLSYTPEGLVDPRPNPPPTAVLPCQHHFHAHCLELITCDNQAQTPPCIRCASEDRANSDHDHSVQ